MLGRVGYLVVKEFLTVWRDPRVRVVLVFPPMVQLLIFSFAVTHEVRNATLGIYAEDDGRAARELLARLRAVSRTFPRVKYLDGPGAVRRAIDGQQVLAVVHIGPGFSKELEAGRPTSLQILLDGRRANAALIVQGYINRIVQGFAAEWSGNGGRETLVPRMWFNPNLDSVWSSVPALVGILTNLVALLVTALSVARERELGTFEQLLVSPLRPAEILLGKALPAVVLGFAEGLLMVVMLLMVFRLPFTGSAAALVLAMAMFLVATVGVGLFISSLAKTQQQGLLGAFTYMVPAVLLSGFATPVGNIPPWLRWVAYIDPLQYMITISRAVFLEGPGVAEVARMAWPLAPIGLVTLTAAAWLFRRRME